MMKSMPEDEERPQIPSIPKETFSYLPAFASCIAICWQVGVLYPLGGFYFFSFTEHLVAATVYLPFGIGVAGFLVLVPFAIHSIVRRSGSPSTLVLVFLTGCAVSFASISWLTNRFFPFADARTYWVELLLISGIFLVWILYARRANYSGAMFIAGLIAIASTITVSARVSLVRL